MSDAVLVAIIAAMPSALALLVSRRTHNEMMRQVIDLRVHVNSKMDELLRVYGEAERAKGKLEGQSG
jgi:hypothetical protein